MPLPVTVRRLPEAVILGGMKCGTTSLFRWLTDLPAVHRTKVKEPNFFCDDARWQRGLDWYSRLYAEAAPEELVLEASVSYLDPALSPLVLERMRAALPDAKLIAVLRDPIDRTISHYQHETLKAREDRDFASAIADGDSSYLRRSLYSAALTPFLEGWPSERLLVLGFRQLVETDAGWRRVLDFLELDSAPWPASEFNPTRDKPQYTPLMRRLYETGVFDRLPRLPGFARRIGRRLLLRESALPELGRGDLPPAALAGLEADSRELRERLGPEIVDWL